MSYYNANMTMFSNPILNRSKFNLSQLKAYYKFNESSGNLINQASTVGSSDSNGIDGVNTGTVHGATGKIGNAYDYAVNTDVTLCGSTGNWDFLHVDNATSTIVMWVYITAFHTLNEVLSTTNFGSNAGIAIWTSSADNKIKSQVNKTSGTSLGSVTNSIVLSTGTWYFVAVRFDEANTTLKVTVNSTTVSNTSMGAGDTTSSHPLRLGNNSATSVDGMDGRIDELSAWGRYLSDDEITTLYNSGNGFEL